MTREVEIFGKGTFASVSDCPPYRTIYLYQTKGEAEKAKGVIDKYGCGGGCINSHFVTTKDEVKTMKQKTGLTLEQHKKLGNELVQIENKFSEVWTDLLNSYPKGKRIGAKNLCTIIHNINYLKGVLEALLYEDSKKWGDNERKGFCYYYYPETKAGTGLEHSPYNHEH